MTSAMRENIRHREVTELKHEVFFEVLSQCGNIAEALRAAGLQRSYARALRKNDKDFAEKWGDALLNYQDALRQAAFHRAVKGVLEPQIYKGRMCYEYEHDENGRPKLDENNLPIPVMENGKPKVLGVLKYSDSLLLAMLKAKCAEFKDVSRLELGNIPGEEFKTNNDVEAARKIAFVLAKGLRAVHQAPEDVPDDGSDLA